MTEPEVSLFVAMHYIESGKAGGDVAVAIDGAHVKIKETVLFDVTAFLRIYGYRKEGGDGWKGYYRKQGVASRIEVHARSGEGDVKLSLSDGGVLYVESKKIRSGSSGEYPAMREAIGQLMTRKAEDVIPAVAVPYTKKSADLAKEWRSLKAIRDAGIRFLLVKEDGKVEENQ